MNLELARSNMVEQQIRPWRTLDADLLALLHRMRREDFAPPMFRALAYADFEIPLNGSAAMLSPKIEAQALCALQVQKHETALLIGAGSGYMAGLLGELAARVCAVDIDPSLVDLARANLQRAGCGNVELACGDAAAGWAAGAPYDIIMVAGGLPRLPAALCEQLKVSGRLFAIVGAAPAQQACLVTRDDQGFATTALFETGIALLANTRPTHFDF